jgi:hypothetical protein
MAMDYSGAETALNELKRTVASLRSGVDSLERGDPSADDIRGLAERITQALIKVDGVAEISKGAAAEAFRAKDRKTATVISVLIARRKRVVRDLNDLGDRVDELAGVSGDADGVDEIDLAGGDDAAMPGGGGGGFGEDG